MSGKFEMFVENDKKVFRAFAEGFFSMEDGQAFVTDFINKSKGLGAYTLIIDVKGVKPSSPQVAEALGEAIKLYVTTPFKDRYMVKQASAVGHMQFKRLASDIISGLGLADDVLKYVDSKEDAYKLV